MQTEISFLLSLILDHKLPREAKKACQERIKEVEQVMTVRAQQAYAVNAPAIVPAAGVPPKSAAQLKFEQEMAAGVAPVIPQAPRMPPAEMDKETGRPMVSTGGGTKGPRKF